MFKNIENLFHKLFRRRKTLKPGDAIRVDSLIPADAKSGVIIINYGDIFGNEYETRCTLDFKEKKVVKQEFMITKKVKEIGDIPKLQLNENEINWPDTFEN